MSYVSFLLTTKYFFKIVSACRFEVVFVLCFIFVQILFRFVLLLNVIVMCVKKTLLLFFKSRLLSIITIVSKRLFNLSGVLFHAAHHAFPSLSFSFSFSFSF